MEENMISRDQILRYIKDSNLKDTTLSANYTLEDGTYHIEVFTLDFNGEILLGNLHLPFYNSLQDQADNILLES